jgi:hypothetical protein
MKLAGLAFSILMIRLTQQLTGRNQPFASTEASAYFLIKI